MRSTTARGSLSGAYFAATSHNVSPGATDTTAVSAGTSADTPCDRLPISIPNATTTPATSTATATNYGHSRTIRRSEHDSTPRLTSAATIPYLHVSRYPPP